MTIVYFDRNVFADLCELRRGVTENEVAKIQHAVESGSIMIPSSVTLIEETIGMLRESDEKYNEHIKTVFDLVDKKMMVKPPVELLRDDCYSYARQEQYERITDVPSEMRDILDLSKNRADLIELAEDITQTFKQSAANITEGLLEARIEGEEKNVGTPDDFNEVWEGFSLTMVENLLAPLPRPIRRLCKKRGHKNMLRIKSIRLYTIYYAWLLYSGWFGVRGQPRRMREGDVGDFFHAIQSSAADIFVTQESKTKKDKLPYILTQVPTSGFQVLSLDEFLRAI